MGHDQEGDFSSDVAVQIDLAEGGAEGDEEEDEPGKTDFEKHLEVEPFEHARIKLGSHEEVVNVVARHAVSSTTNVGRHVSHDGDDIASKDGDAHQRAKLVDEGVHLEQTGVVKEQSYSNGGVEGPDTGAPVSELLAVLVRQRLSRGVDAGHDQVQNALEDKERPVDGPGFRMRESACVGQVEQVLAECLPGHAGLRGKLAVVVGGPNPHVPHEQREADHHGRHSQRASKVKVRVVVNPGITAHQPSIDDFALALTVAAMPRLLRMCVLSIRRLRCAAVATIAGDGRLELGGGAQVFGGRGRWFAARDARRLSCCSSACSRSLNEAIGDRFARTGREEGAVSTTEHSYWTKSKNNAE